MAFQTDAPEFTPEREAELRASVWLGVPRGRLDRKASEPVAGMTLKVYRPMRFDPGYYHQ